MQGAWFSTKSGERFCDDVCGRSQTNAECSAAHVPRSHGSRYSKPVQCGQARDFERGKRVCSACGTETCMSRCVLHRYSTRAHSLFDQQQHTHVNRVVSADSKQLHDTQRHGVIPRLRKSAQHTGHLYQGVARWPVTLTRPWPGQGCATLHLVVLTRTPTQDTRHTHTLTTYLTLFRVLFARPIRSFCAREWTHEPSTRVGPIACCTRVERRTAPRLCGRAAWCG